MFNRILNSLPRLVFFGLMLCGIFFWLSPSWAGRVVPIKINGQDFEPKEVKVWPGETLRICNESMYRRQPYSRNKYNKFGSRKPNREKMLKKGECTEVEIKNPTPRILKVVIRDAVAGKAKLTLLVWQASPPSQN